MPSFSPKRLAPASRQPESSSATALNVIGWRLVNVKVWDRKGVTMSFAQVPPEVVMQAVLCDVNVAALETTGVKMLPPAACHA